MRFVLLILSFFVLSMPTTSLANTDCSNITDKTDKSKCLTSNAVGSFTDWIKSKKDFLEEVVTKGVLHGVAWIFASIFLITALLKLKEASRDPRASYAPPIAFFIAALILANIETSITISTGMSSTSSSNNTCSDLSSYLSTHSSERAGKVKGCFNVIDKTLADKIAGSTPLTKGMNFEEMMAVLYLIQIIGFIYFIYGVTLIPKLSEPGGQITPMKPILHILFSSILINITSYF